MTYLLSKKEKPLGFVYPKELHKLIELGLVDFEVWYILNQERASARLEGLRERYPNRHIIPFAKRDDCDDIACFDMDNSNKVCIIHDFASPGYEQRESFNSLWEWLRVAIDLMIEYELLENGM